MIISVNLRQLGRKRGVSAVPFELPGRVDTVRGLLTAMVTVCVAAYNERVRRGESGVRPMTADSLADMESIGKLAFGVNHSGKLVDEAPAISNALQSFEDGLYRVFHGQRELTSLDEGLSLAEGDEVTLIRLTMLTGSIF